jgi:DNA mismatch repair protein MutS2
MRQAKKLTEKELSNLSLKELEFPKLLEIIGKFTFSSQGKEIILSLEPSEDRLFISEEHNLIEEMTNLHVADDTIPFESISDIRDLLHKSMIENAVLSSTEILSVFDIIRSSRLVKSYFDFRREKYPKLHNLSNELFADKLIEKHITDCIEDSGEIKDTATRELAHIRKSINEKSNRLRTRLQKILRKVSEDDMVQEDFVTMREGRYVLPIKAHVKRQLPGIIHGVSQTGSTVFLEPSEIIEMNNELNLLINEEQREIYKILQNLTKEISTEALSIMRTTEIIAHFDSILARAKFALEYGGIKPTISDERYIKLHKIKHPLLVVSKGAKNVIPLSIEFTEQKRGFLISGPNAGGKTVALKSIGLNISMALAGIFPLGLCTTDFRRVYTSIGDHQSIENDLSTFSSQMYQMREILANSDSSALALVDEIGSGTDPQEGGALASGILDTFIELNMFFIATTHQSSLKTYALNKDEIENASLEFNEDKLQPTYKFLSGIPGNSYAFFLAKSIGMSDLVIKRAKSYLGSKQKELEESISVLQKFRTEAIKAKAEAEKLKLKAKEKEQKFATKMDDINAKRDVIIKQAKQEALDIVKNANALIENTIKEIKEEKKAIKEIKTNFEDSKQKLEKQVSRLQVSESSDKATPASLKEGDFVSLESGNEGIVLEADDKDKIALVEINGLKFRLPYKQLSKIAKLKPEKKSSDFTNNFRFDAPTQIDVRGMRAEMAVRKVDEAISDALMSNVHQLTIVHGKGTGALKEQIHEMLNYHHSISSFRLGDLVEGGAGVTIIEL